MTTTKELLPPPKTCDLCTRPTVVAQVEVDDVHTNKRRRGAFSEFRDYKSTKRVLAPRYSFIAWWARCQVCFYTTQDQQELDYENHPTRQPGTDTRSDRGPEAGARPSEQIQIPEERPRYADP